MDPAVIAIATTGVAGALALVGAVVTGWMKRAPETRNVYRAEMEGLVDRLNGRIDGLERQLRDEREACSRQMAELHAEVTALRRRILP